MEGREFSAKTVELAIEAGLKELGLTKETAEIVVLEEPRFLKKAKVSVAKKLSEGERALDFIERLLEKMGVSAVVELKETEEESELVINTMDSNTVIGKRGEALDAVQYLASMYANTDKETFRRIVVDCENYRAKRVEILKSLADKLAKKADATGHKVQLEPMNPYERRIIHSALQGNELVTTESRGEDPNRYVVIFPKNRKFDKKPGGKPFNRDQRSVGGFNRDRREGDRREGAGAPRGDRNFGGNRDGVRYDRNERDRSRGGFNRDRDRDRNPPVRKKEDFGFGTFLGNSKDLAPKPTPDDKEKNFGE